MVVVAPFAGGVTTTRASFELIPQNPSLSDNWQCGTPQDCLFATGYVQHHGPQKHLQHLLENVAPCEGGPDWSVTNYKNGYVSRFQFTPGSWQTAARATGLADHTNPYDVGSNVAWWINAISDPGSREGWPVCWHSRSN